MMCFGTALDGGTAYQSSSSIGGFFLGDVRLASLLASANTAAHGRHGQQLLQQIQADGL